MRHLPPCQRVELGFFHGAVIGRQCFPLARRRHEIGHDVDGADAKNDDVFAQFHPSVAHIVEQRFKAVGELDQRVEPEGPATALDRVDGPEHGIEPVPVPVTLLDGGKLLLEFEQQFRTFVEIGGLEFVEVTHLLATAPIGEIFALTFSERPC